MPAVRPEPCTLEVLVLAPDEDPVPGIGVEVLPDDGLEETLARRARATDIEGLAVFGGLQPGPYEVRLDRGPTAECVLTGPEPHRVTLRLTEGVDMEGIVVDPGGLPVAGAGIWSRSGDDVREAKTTAGGGFLLQGLPPGKVAVQAHKRGEFCGARHEQELAPGELAECEIVLWPLTHLRGRVVDPAGQGLPGFVVAARPARFQRGYFAAHTDEQGRIGFPPRPAPTDENGAFAG